MLSDSRLSGTGMEAGKIPKIKMMLSQNGGGSGVAEKW